MTDEEMKKMQPAYYAIELRKMVARDMIPQYQHIKIAYKIRERSPVSMCLKHEDEDRLYLFTG